MMREPLFPAERRERIEPDHAECAFAIPSDYAYVEGHFPGNPLVPGVAQIGWAMAVCRRLGHVGGLSVSRYRFVRPIRPGEDVRIEARRGERGFECRVYAAGELASKGTIAPSP